MTRIATFTSNQLIMSENLRLQYEYNDTQFQISTGLRSDNYKGIGRDVQKLLNVEGDYKRLSSYIEDANMIKGRINIMYSSVDTMISNAQSFISQIAAAISGGIVDPAVTTATATHSLDEAVNSLNVSIGGRYLFSGTAVNTRPVDISDPLWVAQSAPSVANTGYYQGTTDILSTQLSDNMSLNYGVIASNSAFEKMLRSFNVAMNNAASIPDLQEAYDLMYEAVEEMSVLQGILSDRANVIESQVARNEEDQTILKSVISDLKEVDVAEATIKFNQIEVQLEASYATSTKVMRLSLIDFL